GEEHPVLCNLALARHEQGTTLGQYSKQQGRVFVGAAIVIWQPRFQLSDDVLDPVLSYVWKIALRAPRRGLQEGRRLGGRNLGVVRSEEHTSELQSHLNLV